MSTGTLNMTRWHDPVAASSLKPAAAQPTTQPLKQLTFADYVVGSKQVEQTPHEQLVDNVQKWVSQTFYGTMLKQVRNSPFRSDLFDGGRGGQAFGGLMDQHLADRMARSSGNKLVHSIVRSIEARKAYSQQAGKGDKDVTAAPRA